MLEKQEIYESYRQRHQQRERDLEEREKRGLESQIDYKHWKAEQKFQREKQTLEEEKEKMLRMIEQEASIQSKPDSQYSPLRFRSKH